AKVIDNQIQCCGEYQDDDQLERALRWLGMKFSTDRNPGLDSDAWLHYYLYGVERVGRMTARRFIGNHDWYRTGAEKLIARQDNLSGFWKGVGQEDDQLISTSLALLFLSKGRRPVLIAKMKHGDDSDWNRHRHDLANLTAYTEKRWLRDLTWQVIDPAAAKVEDLLQSPVLFINGRNAPKFTDA